MKRRNSAQIRDGMQETQTITATCLLCLTTVFAAPHVAPTDEQRIADLAKLFDIDLDTEDGTIRGIRIRRNNDVKSQYEEDDFTLPDLDIRKISDKTVQVRMRRNDLSDLSDVDLEKDVQAEGSEVGEPDERTRRSGSDLFSFLGAKLSQKFGALAGASSGHNAEPDHSYGPPIESYDHKSFDFWTFKKAILSSLLQAVKAIKGGVIALGGQLVKVKGHIISTAGKIVTKKGEAITDFGRHIATKAILAPPPSFGTTAVDHIPNTGVGYPSAAYPYPPSASYGPPSGSYNHIPSNSYGAPAAGYTKRGASTQQFGVPNDLPSGVQAGLLVLKPIEPTSNQYPLSSPYISPRGVQFGAREPKTSSSELRPVAVPAQSRSYFVMY